MTWHTVVDANARCAGGGHKFLRVALSRQADGGIRVAWPGAQAAWAPAEPNQEAPLAKPGAQAERSRVAAYGPQLAPMAARVLAVAVEPGAKVSAGATLVVLEAMKMEHAVVATSDATVATVHIQAGDQVAHGQALITLAAREETP